MSPLPCQTVLGKLSFAEHPREKASVDAVGTTKRKSRRLHGTAFVNNAISGFVRSFRAA